jgi:hypothetical protein
VNNDELDNTMLEVLSFFEEMTYEKIILDWPAYGENVTKGQIEDTLERLEDSGKITQSESDQGPCYKKEMKKKKRWVIF